MSWKHLVRVLSLCMTLAFGSVIGLPMNPKEVGDFMEAVGQPKIVHKLPDEAERDEAWLRRILRRLGLRTD